jgi:hypothetical protein
MSELTEIIQEFNNKLHYKLYPNGSIPKPYLSELDNHIDYTKELYRSNQVSKANDCYFDIIVTFTKFMQEGYDPLHIPARTLEEIVPMYKEYNYR